MLTHHQRLALTSPTVLEPAVMRPSITAGSTTGGDSPSHHHRHKSNAPRTVGDAHFEPAVMGGAGVVSSILHSRHSACCHLAYLEVLNLRGCIFSGQAIFEVHHQLLLCHYQPSGFAISVLMARCCQKGLINLREPWYLGGGVYQSKLD